MGGGLIKRWVCSVILAAFGLTSVMPSSYAQSSLLLPPPGQMVALSSAFNPPVLKGIKVYPDNPLRFDFILDKGDDKSTDDQIKIDSTRLIKYFLASLTIPEKDLWVNLSPYEKDRIVPEAFGQTEMGRDLLAQDYLLKQITASVIYPDGDIGKKFWKKIYALAQEKYGTTGIPVDTFNKVWIVPEKAVVYENNKVGAAYVTESRLKVMLESDYLAEEMASRGSIYRAPCNGSDCLESRITPGAMNGATSGVAPVSDIAKSVLRAIIIPVLEQEVNEGKNFAQLRQVYQSLILATWYKKKIKRSLLTAVYVDRKKTAGVSIADTKEAEKIWGLYVEAFKKGAYNLVLEEKDAYSDDVVPRKYLSGGMLFDWSMVGVKVTPSFDIPKAKDSYVLLGTELTDSDASEVNTEGDLLFLSDFRLKRSQYQSWKSYYIKNPQKQLSWFQHGWPGLSNAENLDEWAVFVVRQDNDNKDEFSRVARSVSDAITSSRYRDYEHFLLWENSMSHRPRNSPVYLVWGISKQRPEKIRVSYINENDGKKTFYFQSSDGRYPRGHGLDKPEVSGARESLSRIMPDGSRWDEPRADQPWGVVSTMEWKRSGFWGKMANKIDALFVNKELQEDFAFLSVMSVLGLLVFEVGGLSVYPTLPVSMRPDSAWQMMTLYYLPLWVKLSLGIAPSYEIVKAVRERFLRYKQDYDAAATSESGSQDTPMKIVKSYFGGLPIGFQASSLEHFNPTLINILDNLSVQSVTEGLSILEGAFGKGEVDKIFQTARGAGAGLAFFYRIDGVGIDIVKELFSRLQRGFRDYPNDKVRSILSMNMYLNDISRQPGGVQGLIEKIDQIEMIWPGVGIKASSVDPLMFIAEVADVSVEHLHKISALAESWPGLSNVLYDTLVGPELIFFAEVIRAIGNGVLDLFDRDFILVLLSKDKVNIRQMIKLVSPEAMVRIEAFESGFEMWKKNLDEDNKRIQMAKALADVYTVMLDKFFNEDIPGMSGDIIATTYIHLLTLAKLGKDGSSSFFEIDPKDITKGEFWSFVISHEIWHHFLSPYLDGGDLAPYEQAAVSELGADLSGAALYQLLGRRGSIPDIMNAFHYGDGEQAILANSGKDGIGYHLAARGAFSIFLKSGLTHNIGIDYVKLFKLLMQYVMESRQDSNIADFFNGEKVSGMGTAENNTGGVDFRRVISNLQTSNVADEIGLYIDEAVLRKFRHASGVALDVMTIQSDVNLNQFFNLSAPHSVTASLLY